MERSDKILCRVIAVPQALFSLLGLVMTPVLYNYGGAAENPTGFHLYLLFWLIGLVSALSLFSALLGPRIFALFWNLAIFGAFTYAFLQKSFRASDTARLLLTASTLATGYLLVTTARELAAAYRQSARPAIIRRRAIYTAATIVVVTAAARLLYVATHTQPALLGKLDSDSEETRCTAARQLSERGHAAAAALPKLVAILGTTTCTRWGADQLPAYIDSIGGVDPFLELMQHASGRAQEKAVMQLMYREHPGANRESDFVAAYVAGLRSDDVFVRRASSQALGFLGMPAASAAPDLIAALSDSDAAVRAGATGSLGRVRSVEGLKLALASPDSNVRKMALEWMDRLRR